MLIVSMKIHSTNWRLDESGNDVKIALIRFTNHFCDVKKCTSIELCILNDVITFPLIFSFFLSFFVFTFYFFFCNKSHEANAMELMEYTKHHNRMVLIWKRKWRNDWCFSFLVSFSHSMYNFFAYEFLLECIKSNQKMHSKIKSYTFYAA